MLAYSPAEPVLAVVPSMRNAGRGVQRSHPGPRPGAWIERWQPSTSRVVGQRPRGGGDGAPPSRPARRGRSTSAYRRSTSRGNRKCPTPPRGCRPMWTPGTPKSLGLRLVGIFGKCLQATITIENEKGAAHRRSAAHMVPSREFPHADAHPQVQHARAWTSRRIWLSAAGSRFQ